MSTEPETLPESTVLESVSLSDGGGSPDQGEPPEPGVPPEPGEPDLPLPGEPKKPPQKPKKKHAFGTLVRNEADRIVATFVVEGRIMTFQALIERGLQPFTSKEAKLTYEYKEDLRGSHVISGTVGTSKFNLQFDNGPHITGTINQPTPSSKNDVYGNGEWEVF